VLEENLKQGGILWIKGFCEMPEDNPDIKQEDIITP
jgi:hypothetical protein